VATKLSQFLKEAPSLKPLVGRLERISELQRIYNETAPSALARASRVGGIEGNTAIIIASSGTVAAGLRQRLPSLLVQIQAIEREITAIRVDVQVDLTSGNNIKKQPLTLPSRASESLLALHAKLPDSRLKTAIGHLAGRGRKTR
jgi:hypothetical protein